MDYCVLYILIYTLFLGNLAFLWLATMEPSSLAMCPIRLSKNDRCFSEVDKLISINDLQINTFSPRVNTIAKRSVLDSQIV